MCGICGIVDRAGTGLEGSVRAMCRALAHRGPDDEGIVSGPGWTLGHRRLSIIDLSSHARQPMANEDGNCFLAHNGEIYNYKELRRELLQHGHRFASDSDSEAILHLFEDEGPDSAARLNGMFAFAVLDARRRQLVLCRDRLGIKPLCYARAGSAFLFASEPKALFCHPGLRPVFDRRHLRQQIQRRDVAGAGTVFQGVLEVPPAHTVAVDLETGRESVRRYWSPVYALQSDGGLEDQIRRSLDESVAMELMSDVPLGTQLSGGLDSGIVTALAARHRVEPTHTFSVSFAGTPEDESEWARLVAGHLGTIHHSISYSVDDFLADLAYATFLNDKPVTHPNSLALLKLCREARREVKVLLTGEGADELFGGYPWHRRMWRLRRFASFMPSRPARGLRAVLPEGSRWRYAAGLLSVSPREAAASADEFVPDSVYESLCADLAEDQAPSLRAGIPAAENDPLAAVLAMDLQTYLESVLHRQDRMSMASGVESRVPYLNDALVKTVCRIHPARLFEDGRGKAPLRHIGRDLLPAPVLFRSKVGFSVPIAEWMRRADGLGAALDWLCDDRAESRGFWHVPTVRALIERHRRGDTDLRDVLWSLLALEVWARLWMDGTRHEDLREQLLAKAGGREAGPSRAPAASRRLRVCHVLPSLEIGGMERVAADLMAGMKARGHVTAVFCLDARGPLYARAAARAKACSLRRASRFKVNLRAVRQLARFVKRHEADVIHAHNLVAHLYCVLASLLVKRPVIVTLHGQGYYDSGKTLLLRRTLALRTARVIPVSEDIRRRLLEANLASDKKIRVIRNGVDVEKFRAAEGEEKGGKEAKGDEKETIRENLGMRADAFIIGSVGRLAPEKDYPMLVRAFAEMSKRCQVSAKSDQSRSERSEVGGQRTEVGGQRSEVRDQKSEARDQRSEVRGQRSVASGQHPSFAKPTAGRPAFGTQDSVFPPDSSLITHHYSLLHYSHTPILLLVGDGPERGRLEDLIRQLGIGEFAIMPGTQEDVRPWLECMDVFCLSSITEGTSMTLLEAGACGLPSVVTDVGGNREIVGDNASGIVVPAGDESAFAEALGRLYADGSLRARLGAEARRRVKEGYSAEQMIRAYEQIYREVLEESV